MLNFNNTCDFETFGVDRHDILDESTMGTKSTCIGVVAQNEDGWGKCK
jgi:hypothetical protein